MFRLTAKVAVLVLLGASTLSAASPATSNPSENKKPWEWTLAERLAVRLDPERIAERQLKDETQHRAFGTQSKPAPREGVNSYGIDGRQHPELLLPHELFEALMTGFVPDEERRERTRELYRHGIVSSGFDGGLFWAQLSSAVSEFVEYKYYEARPSGGFVSRDCGQECGCRLAFDALTAARQVFGQERFDRFLYEAIAPHIQLASATNAADPSVELRRLAAGCR